jgi:hypothetical protein
MRCKQVQTWIGLESDGQLSPDKVPHLESHLEVCSGCRAYRSDLQVGRRLLRATGPDLAEGFEWRLQLRLNNALKEAAREAAAPWPLVAPNWRRWFGTFGVSASLGLAAVLATAMFLVPGQMRTLQNATVAGDQFGRRVPVETAQTAAVPEAFDGSRRALTRPDARGLGAIQRTVSLPSGSLAETRWPTNTGQVRQLWQENEILRRRLATAEERSRALQARLDSLAGHP